ncbi:MAG: hypothetical protein U9R66_10130 [Thermodesulfobacteriota bacterium]|nr:hypothetical protein [Thermodesulfobacteriota bacterium]
MKKTLAVILATGLMANVAFAADTGRTTCGTITEIDGNMVNLECPCGDCVIVELPEISTLCPGEKVIMKRIPASNNHVLFICEGHKTLKLDGNTAISR